MTRSLRTPWWFDRELAGRAWRGTRLEVDRFALPPAEPDPVLVALVREPFTSVTDVADRLGSLEGRLVERDDRRCVFLTVYTEMTARTRRAIDAGTFADPVWMRRYLVAFAEYYRRAFLAFERGNLVAVPAPWIVAFGAARRKETLVLQDALLGINAHIVYDLALTLADTGLDPNRAAKYADHRRVDGILARLVAVQRGLLAERYAPGLDRVGDALAGLDEVGSAAALRAARETAWRAAVVRTDTRLPGVATATEWLLSRAATGNAGVLLRPTASPAAMRTLHDVESDRLDLRSYVRAFHERSRYRAET